MSKKGFSLSPYIEKIFETSGEHAEWGGYYNYDFLSADGTKLLCNRSPFDGRKIEKGDTVEVGYYDIPTGEWHCLDKSDSFNWPQATMLQWIPNTNNKEVVFNLSKDNHLISRIINIETGEKRDLCYPIYCVTPDGKKAITLNLERSYWTPAYHYQSVANEACNVDVLEGDGIFALDLKENTLERIISLEDVIKLKPEEAFSQGKHWLEHIMINPSGTEIVFLHRYNLPNTGRLTRMVMANIDGSNMHVIDGWSKYTWSHFGWKTDDSFVIYSRSSRRKSFNANVNVKQANDKNVIDNVNTSLKVKVKSAIRVLIKNVFELLPTRIKVSIRYISGYQMYVKTDNKYKFTKFYQGRHLDVDGHPSFEKNGKYMITDTYADYGKTRKLVVLNSVNDKRILLGEFYSPLWETPASCDLHPKLSRDGQFLVIDTAYSGIHRMMVFELRWDKIIKKLS